MLGEDDTLGSLAASDSRCYRAIHASNQRSKQKQLLYDQSYDPQCSHFRLLKIVCSLKRSVADINISKIKKQ